MDVFKKVFLLTRLTDQGKLKKVKKPNNQQQNSTWIHKTGLLKGKASRM